VEGAGRHPGVDLGDVGDVRGGGGGDARGLVPGIRRVELADQARGGQQAGRIGVALLEQRGERPFPGPVERHLGDVDHLGGVGIVGGAARAEGGLGAEAFDPRREGPQGAALEIARSGVDRHLGIGDRLPLDAEDAEGEAVLAGPQDPGRGRDHRSLAARDAEDLLERAALGGGELRGGRGRAAGRGVLPPVVGSAAAQQGGAEGGQQDERERGGSGEVPAVS
jgi:hypothetical protein